MSVTDNSGLDPTVHGFRWIMLFGASLVYACFGALMSSMAVLVKPISESLQLDAWEMGTVLGAWQFVYLFTSIPTGALLDRFGLRPCLLAAGAILTASSALRVFADSYAGLLIAVLVFGIGGPLISVGAPKLVSRWFAGNERGLAMGLYTSSVGIGALLALVLTNSIVMPLVGNDWHLAFGVYTLVTLVSVVVWLLIVSHPLSRLGNRQSSETFVPMGLSVFSELLKLRQLRLILVLALAVFFFTHALSAWLPEIIRAQGLTLIAASNWSALPTLVAIPAVLIIPRLAHAERRLPILVALSVAGIVGVLALKTDPVMLMTISLTLLGLARGCLMPIAMLSLMDVKGLGSDKMGAASGLFFTAAEVGGVLGPVLCGLAISLSGSYALSQYLIAASLVLALLQVWLLSRK